MAGSSLHASKDCKQGLAQVSSGVTTENAGLLPITIFRTRLLYAGSDTKTIAPFADIATPAGSCHCESTALPSAMPNTPVPAKVVTSADATSIIRIKWLP
jgi:hypothetical protein